MEKQQRIEKLLDKMQEMTSTLSPFKVTAGLTIFVFDKEGLVIEKEGFISNKLKWGKEMTDYFKQFDREKSFFKTGFFK